MATFSELVYDVREALKQYTDDSEITNRYIEYLYGIKRAKYLQQALNRLNQAVPNSAKQQFCLTMSEVSPEECSIEIDCKKIVRSNKPIPTPIDLHSGPAILNVKPSLATAKGFNFVDKKRIPYLNGNPFGQGIYAFLDTNDYIYAYSKNNINLLECVSVEGVFEDPTELKDYQNCCDCTSDDTTCYDRDTTDYPIPPRYIDLIKREIIVELAELQKLPEDLANDGENA